MATQLDLNDVNVFAIAAVEGTITAAARHPRSARVFPRGLDEDQELPRWRTERPYRHAHRVRDRPGNLTGRGRPFMGPIVEFVGRDLLQNVPGKVVLNFEALLVEL